MSARLLSDVAFGSFPDLGAVLVDVRFTPTTGHRQRGRLRPKSAISDIAPKPGCELMNH
jgi:hypothetical protein